MLKINIQNEAESTRFKLDGKLVGPWVWELEFYWNMARANQQGQSILVDLTDVTFIDSNGKDLLARMHQQGATLLAVGCMTRSIVEEVTRRLKAVS